MMMKKRNETDIVSRESNYDLLRIVSCIAVIAIHISGTYMNAITDKEVFGELYTDHMLSTIFYYTLSRFAVPCFVMLSGAFILSDERNKEYKYFYKKSINSIGITTMFFSLIYFLYYIILACASIIFLGGGVKLLFKPVRSIIIGAPFYHMWYLYMLIGVYLLAPIVIRFKSSIEEKTFKKIAWTFLVIASLSVLTSTHKLYWDIGFSFCYLGYFMIGFELRKWSLNKKSNFRGVILIILGIAIELIPVYLQYKYLVDNIDRNEAYEYLLIDWQAPLIVVSSVLIFIGFSLLDVKKDFGKLSSHTFLIYLFHAGVWTILNTILIYTIGIEGDNRVVIPIMIVLVFLISYLLSILYKKIKNKINIKLFM